MDNGEFLFQKIYFNSLIAGTYAFKTVDKKYHTLSYVILDKNIIKIEGLLICFQLINHFIKFNYYLLAYILSDEESYYEPGKIETNNSNGVQWLNFFIDSKGFHIKEIINPADFETDVLDSDFIP